MTTKRLTNAELRQIIDSHEKGHCMVIRTNADYRMAKELLAVREAQSVPKGKFAGWGGYHAERDAFGSWLKSTPEADNSHAITKHGYVNVKLYTAPPAPAVPDAVDYSDLDATSQDREVVEAIAECRGWNACRAAMLNHSGDSNEKVPAGFKLVPADLTAENGAKASLIGEFTEVKYISCPECFGDDECESCDGSGRIKVEVPVTWTTIKAIWKKGIEHFDSLAAAPTPAK